MKKTIKETRDLMNKINEFLGHSAPHQAAEKFKSEYAQILISKLGPNWQSKGIGWSKNSNVEKIIHDLVRQFLTKKYSEYMGDKDTSEKFIQSVMAELD